MTTSSRTIKNLNAFRASDAGAAAVELAVVLPVLMLLAIGIADYSRVFASAITVANAAKAGAQYGVQTTVTSNDTAAINFAARQDALDAGSITVTSTRVCRCADGSIVNCVTATCEAYGAPRIYVTVTVSKAVDMLFDYPGLPAAINVSRTATLRAQ